MKSNPLVSIFSARFGSAVAVGLLSIASLVALPDSVVGQEKDQEQKQEKQEKKQEQEQPQDLKIGSKAPTLDIEHWISDRDGEFSQVTEFESGKVYIVEFWATWCGPCISSMPHLVHLQDTYASKGVQIISVSSEDLETVEKFLDKDVRKGRDSDPEAEDMTYAQLTGKYCLTTDPDRSVNNDYMKAAGRNGIPCAFIVGKSGLIEWIGHPIRMEEVLESVVTDSWDREAFNVEFAKAAAIAKKFQTLTGKIRELMRDSDLEGAIKEIDAASESFPVDSREKSQITRMRNSIAIMAGGEHALGAVNSVVDSQDPSMILSIASRILRKGEQDGSLDDEMAEALLKAADKATEFANAPEEAKDDEAAKDEEAAKEEKAAKELAKMRIVSVALFTKSKTYLRMGRFDDAIAAVTKALEMRDEQFLKDMLEKIETAKQKASEPAVEDTEEAVEEEPTAEPNEKEETEE